MAFSFPTLPFGIDPVFLFWIIGLGIFLFAFRKNVEVQFPLFLLKSRRFGEWVYQKSKGWKKIIAPLADFGILVGFVGMAFCVYFLGKSLWDVFQPGGAAAVSIIVPGVRVPGSPVFLPFTYGIISIAILALVHELAHAIVASSHGVRPKSIALALFLFIPAAGVEIDEKKLGRHPLRTKLRIFAAGSFANLLCALFILLLSTGIAFVARPHVIPSGTEIVSVSEGSPAYGILSEGETIVAMNGVPVLKLEDFVLEAGKLVPGDSIELEKSDGTKATVVAGPREENPEKGRIGITTRQNVRMTEIGKIFVWILGLFSWVFNLNIGVAIINLFPFPIMDGGRMFSEVIRHYFRPKTAEKINKVSIFVFAPLLALNILVPIVKAIFFK